jgi:hypothetical protein
VYRLGSISSDTEHDLLVAEPGSVTSCTRTVTCRGVCLELRRQGIATSATQHATTNHLSSTLNQCERESFVSLLSYHFKMPAYALAQLY